MIPVISVGSIHYAFKDVKKAAEALKLLTDAMLVERHYDDGDWKYTIPRKEVVRLYSLELHISTQTSIGPRKEKAIPSANILEIGYDGGAR